LATWSAEAERPLLKVEQIITVLRNTTYTTTEDRLEAAILVLKAQY